MFNFLSTKTKIVEYQCLENPLTLGEIRERVDETGYIKVIVSVCEYELLNTKFDNFLELINSKVLKNGQLNDISHNMVGCIPEKRSVLYEVKADVSGILKECK